MDELDTLDVLDWIAPVQHDEDFDRLAVEWPAYLDQFAIDDELID